ncbi:hypothetical protein CVT24_000110 [Panaeolus cyanescens]|uniref:Uncharacterized protein n=1 Tax=Panaeolus cyanescens TaxID=181874 RepID=A0A409W7N8_9AGAR|nr:hypothetical protein CVT24_000110 [Panaeolus cyanescens]
MSTITYNLSELTFVDIAEVNSAVQNQSEDRCSGPVRVVGCDVRDHIRSRTDWIAKLNSKLDAESDKVMHSVRTGEPTKDQWDPTQDNPPVTLEDTKETLFPASMQLTPSMMSAFQRRALYSYRIFYLPEKYNIMAPSGERVLPNDTTILVRSPIHPLYAFVSGMLFFSDMNNTFAPNKTNAKSWSNCRLACFCFKQTINLDMRNIFTGWDSIDKEYREACRMQKERNSRHSLHKGNQ